MEGNVTGDVAIALKAMRGLTAQGFDSAYLPPIKINNGMNDLSRYMTLFNARLVEATRTKTQTKSPFDTGTIGQTKVNAPAVAKPKATLKKATKTKTQAAMKGVELGTAGPQAMRHMMDLASNLDQIDTSQEQDLDIDLDQDEEGYEPVPTTPENLPAVINQDVMAQGKVEPEWHMVKHLPGYVSKPIRAMGRQLFRAFTSTPIEKVNVLANLMGSGPNSKKELNAVAGTVHKLGRRLTEAEIEFESIMPGYSASTKIYEYKGYVFMLVQDFAGQYVYSWPTETNLLGND